MEIYLDANATTPVLPQARAAALSVMAEAFGNPSSIHGSGLRARAVLDEARATARRVLGASTGRLLFTSGATEGIQTAVLSALTALRRRRDTGESLPQQLLYGATEHKAVPEALKHWNALLGLHLKVVAIPVGLDGRHDLAWLREQAPQAGLVCTMAANNETGVISDLDGIAEALQGSPALWLVDGVQALGKLALDLDRRPIDYAPFSGHKLYAPKGIGMLYVRDGAPFTPLIAGGGQEGALRSGTENMAGIAALGAVLKALESGEVFASAQRLAERRERLAAALRDAFPGVVFNAPFALSLPTTLNVSVPGLSAKLLLDLFDAAGLRVSGGSACGASRAQPSYVLEAMGLPAWRTAAAVRLSFGGADADTTLDEACRRLRACGESLRASCQIPSADEAPRHAERLTRFVVDGACCYVVADEASRRAVVIDPLPELTERLAQWMRCRGIALAAVLDTHSHGDHASSAPALRAAAKDLLAPEAQGHRVDALGWPLDQDRLALGALRLSRLATPGHTEDATAYLLHEGETLRAAFVGDTVMPGALGRSDFTVSAPLAFGPSLKTLAERVGADVTLLPGHDYDDRFATTLAIESLAQPLLDGVLRGRLSAEAFAAEKAELERDLPPTEYQTMACGARVACARAAERVEMSAAELRTALRGAVAPVLVDVREDYEVRLSPTGELAPESVPLSTLLNALPRWSALPADAPVIFFCRSGNRSAQAAKALRRFGHAQAWSLEGGLALWDAEKISAPADGLAFAI
ncbi:MAG: aminotransferase class V-fold PLP-dependent enzyme [Mitsuaria chitosanitabida]|uniref:aminotransferase class V-fold PLP-dependent enzyme n=1 Tax=Roseateles chitosanitabidus TaxID=65048 RepID=UPI001B21BB0E|nr:aminotransferase class V-fold PLP-dependent enzyme [Roseateles chitosanitabidus]MBO9685938.1 aminotransferase class V-fold PLP-dependent enzyme [Roseateles chitosanitabidus]